MAKDDPDLSILWLLPPSPGIAGVHLPVLVKSVQEFRSPLKAFPAVVSGFQI